MVILPVHANPSPVYPPLQEQVLFPGVFAQLAFSWQPPLLIRHSFTSEINGKYIHECRVLSWQNNCSSLRNIFLSDILYFFLQLSPYIYMCYVDGWYEIPSSQIHYGVLIWMRQIGGANLEVILKIIIIINGKII